MEVIDYSQINTNRNSHEKWQIMNHHKSFTIHYAQIWSNLEFVIRNKNSQKKKKKQWKTMNFLLFDVYTGGLFPTISVQPDNVCHLRPKVLVKGVISQSRLEALIGKYNFLKVLSN